ncbi:Hint domain-containing protein [Roseovarius aquimarinus]|uniref:Hint domain-containing protein n=1 Tax=Roseovarius aquimarinus TaxID=1229156 RepID=A0ABW7I8V1_9RHOB
MAFVSGTSGNDTIITGAENDVVWGDDGNDAIRTGAGDDLVGGGLGNDTIIGEAGDDDLYGNEGNDVLLGGEGNDYLAGNQGADSLDAGAGRDTLDGGEGSDLMFARDGDDRFFGDAGNDTIYGGGGNDTGGGGTGNDLIYGDDGNDFLGGEEGRDTIYGGTGNDSIGGGADEDLIYGGADNDTIDGLGGNDTLYGDAGNDRIAGGVDNDLIDGGAGDDTVGGDEGNDVVKGGDGRDSVSGGAGDDQLLGDEGDDTLSGGTGNDTMAGGAGADRYVVRDGNGDDVISDFDVVNDRLAFDMAEIARFRDAEARMTQDGADTLFTFDNGNTLRLQNVSKGDLRPANVESVNGPICICAGMPVETARGPVAVEHLREGDMVLTRDGGAARVRMMLHETRVFRDREDRRRPVLIAAGALGDGIPAQDVRLSPQHRVMMRDTATGEERLVAACKLTGLRGVRRMRGVASAEYYNILLETHEILGVANLPVESLLVAERSLPRLPKAEQAVWRARPAMTPARPIDGHADDLEGVAFGAQAPHWMVIAHATPVLFAAE